MPMTDQSRRVAFFRPWGEVDPGDRLDALETAIEIIFSDKSAVVREGLYAGGRTIDG